MASTTIVGTLGVVALSVAAAVSPVHADSTTAIQDEGDAAYSALPRATLVTPSFSDLVQRNRAMVVEVNKHTGHVRVKDDSGRLIDLVYAKHAIVLADGEAKADLGRLNPGDIIRLTPPAGGRERVTVLRRGWMELGSPER